MKPQRTIIMSSAERPDESLEDDLLIAIEFQIEYNRQAELDQPELLDREAELHRESNRVPRVSVEDSDNNSLQVEEDTTNDFTIAAMLQHQLNDDGQHTQSNRVEPPQSNKEEEDDPELVQAIRESKETARVIQQAQSVSAEYSCNCEECLHWRRAENQCGSFICKLKRTVRIWTTKNN